MSNLVSPRVFNFPFNRFVIGIQINPSQYHGMSHERFTVVQTSCLILSQVNIHASCKVINISCKNTFLTVWNLTNIWTKPNSFSRLHLCNCKLFETVHWEVDITNTWCTHNITQHLNSIRFSVRFISCWSVDNWHIITEF